MNQLLHLGLCWDSNMIMITEEGFIEERDSRHELTENMYVEKHFTWS